MTTPITHLSKSCKACDGKGHFISGVTLGGDFIPELVPCPDCQGRGVVITWEAWSSRAVSQRWTLPSKRERT